MAADSEGLDQRGSISLWEHDGNNMLLVISSLAHLSVAHLLFPQTNLHSWFP